MNRQLLEEVISKVKEECLGNPKAAKYLPYMCLNPQKYTVKKLKNARGRYYGLDKIAIHTDYYFYDNFDLLISIVKHEEAHRVVDILRLRDKHIHGKRWLGVYRDLGGEMPIIFYICQKCNREYRANEFSYFYGGHECPNCRSEINTGSISLLNADAPEARYHSELIRKTIDDAKSNGRYLLLVRNGIISEIN